MRFKVIIGEQVYAIEVPEELLAEAAEFHAKLDRDMDRGWQMSRQFVERPDRLQRCQIVADKLLTSIMNGNAGHHHVDGRRTSRCACPARSAWTSTPPGRCRIPSCSTPRR